MSRISSWEGKTRGRRRETNLTEKKVLPTLIELRLRVDVSLVLPDEGSEGRSVLDVSKEDLRLSVSLLDGSVGGVGSSVKLRCKKKKEKKSCQGDSRESNGGRRVQLTSK